MSHVRFGSGPVKPDGFLHGEGGVSAWDELLRDTASVPDTFRPRPAGPVGRIIPAGSLLFDVPAPGQVSIARGHTLDVLASVPTFDLLATDPPYAMGGEGAEHAIGAVVAVGLREAALRLRKGGWAVVYSASSWRSTYYMVEAVRGVLEPIRIATWTKPVARTKVRTPGWSWASVNVLLFRKPGGDRTGTQSILLDHITAAPLMVGRRAQLPPSVARWSVEPFAEPGGLMLDPFSGSGALPQAAADLGMAAIGIEANP